MNQTLFQTELSLHYPPWLGVLKAQISGLLDVKDENQQVLCMNVNPRIS